MKERERGKGSSEEKGGSGKVIAGGGLVGGPGEVKGMLEGRYLGRLGLVGMGLSLEGQVK